MAKRGHFQQSSGVSIEGMGLTKVSNEIKAVVFDMDGLLLDTEPLYQADWREAADKLSYTLSDQLNQSLICKSEPGPLRMLRNEFGDDFPTPSFISVV